MHRLDRDLLEADPEVLRERGRVLARVIGAVARRHRHTQHRRRPERLGGDAGGEGRVDAAGEPHDGGAEAALAHIVADAEDERREHLGGERVGSRRGGGGEGLAVDPEDARVAAGEVGDDERLLEERGPREDASVRSDEHRAAVEEERVVPADLVHVRDRHAVPARARGEHPLAERRLAGRVRRGGDVHDEGCAGAGELRDGIASVAGPVPEALVVPDVLADGETEPERQPPGVRGGRRLRGEEVAGLVEDVVRGEERLAPDRGDPAAGEERGRVVDARRRRVRGRLGEPEDDGDAARPLRRLRQLGEGAPSAVEELG